MKNRETKEVKNDFTSIKDVLLTLVDVNLKEIKAQDDTSEFKEVLSCEG